MRRFNFVNFAGKRVSLLRHCSSSSTSSTSSSTASATSSFQYHAGRAAGILIPFGAVWMGSQYMFGNKFDVEEAPNRDAEVGIIVQPSNNNNGATLGGPFELMDCSTGKSVTDKDVFFVNSNNNNQQDQQQKWSLLYFGFSKCAEVCPRNLKFMTDVVQSLSKKGTDRDDNTIDFQDKVQIVFVSVDPIRDKPEVLKEYLNQKIPAGVHWKGLCGSQEQVSSVCKAWRVYYSSMNESDEERDAREAKGMTLEEAIGTNNENYQLDHSAAVYFVAPGGRLRDLFFDEMGKTHAADRIDLHLSGAYSGMNKV